MAEPRGGAPRPTGAGEDHRRGAPLGAFASRLAARWVAEAPDERYRSLDGSLVSADLSGFTAMSERLAARGKEGSERLTATVNSCFTALIAAAEREGGDVLKFGGDALLLWFDGNGHAQRAARAGARMQRSINAPRFSRAGLTMTVGGHSGRFDFFLVGRPDWRELVVVGRGASTTVDLEAAAPSGQVLVSREMAKQLPVEWRGRRHAGGVELDLDAIPLPRRPVPMMDTAEVPELVAPTLRADVTALANWSGEHRLATIVFAELEGTDASVETAGRDFAESINALVRAAQEASDRYGVQFLYTDIIADGIKLICTAGAPTSRDDDEEAALRFATELVHNDPKRGLRAGVHSGRVFAGFLGSPTRRTYTVMGDPVNLSARLMGKAEPGQVVATAALMARSRAVFETVDLAPFLVKGKTAPIDAVVVGAPTGKSRSRDLTDIPLVGRAEELDRLRDAIAAAVDGRGQVVEIVGDAGIGKTRLLQAVIDDPRILARVATECQPYDTLSPYASVRPLLRRALGIDADATPARAGTVLAATVARVAPELESMVPLLAVPLGAEAAPTAEADAVAEEFRADRTHQVTVELLAAVLTVPTMLVVEDVYYVDDASLRLLQVLAGIVPNRPWMLAVTRRPEGPGLVVGAVEGTLVKLQPLDDSMAARLVEAAAGDKRIASVDLEVMAQRSGGNPLFVLQLVDAAGAGVAADDLPESIERLVATRVDRLTPDDRALVRQAAVIGRVFNTDVLDAMLARDGAQPVEAERWIGLSDLVEPENARTWRFRHALFRDVAYEGLPFARRKRMHLAVGELIEAGVAGEPDVGLLSQHFWLAGDAEKTWRYSVAAGDAAWATFAIAEAIAAYRRALGVRRRLAWTEEGAVSEVAERLGDALERSARYDEAETAYQLARRNGRPSADASSMARWNRKLGVLMERRGDLAHAIRWYRRALRVAGGPGAASRDAAEIEIALAGVRHRQGRHMALMRHAANALSHAQHAEDPWLEAYARNLHLIGGIYGVCSDGVSHGERALVMFRHVGDVLHEGKVLNNLGVEAYYGSRWEAAVAYWKGAAHSFSRAGDVVEQASATNNRAEILSDQGHWDEALAQFQIARRLWTTNGYGVGVAVAMSNLGRLYGRRGELGLSLECLAEAEDRFRDMGAESYGLEVRARRAEALLLCGEPNEAGRTARVLLEELGRENVEPLTEVIATRVIGIAALQMGDRDRAEQVLWPLEQLTKAQARKFEWLQVAEALQHLPATRAVRCLADEQVRVAEQLGVVRLPQAPLPL